MTWSSFKAVVTERTLYIYQTKEDDDCYLLAATDGGIGLECVVPKTDTEAMEDYEDNYKSDITKCCAGEFI